MQFGGTDYDARVALVLARRAVRDRQRLEPRARPRGHGERVQLLNEVGAIADGSLPLAQTLDRILEVSVPAIADFCMIDVLHEERVVRSAVRAVGRSDAREIERYLRERSPTPPEWMTRPEAPFPRQPRYIPEFNEEDMRRLAHDEADLRVAARARASPPRSRSR